MPFNEPHHHYHHHQPSFTPGEPLDNQLPTSPMDTDFSIPPTPTDPVFSQSSTSLSSMDVSFPDSFPSECPASGPASLNHVSSPVAATASFPVQSFLSHPAPQLAQSCRTLSAHLPATQQDSDRRPAFTKKIREMALPLAPLVQLTTGQVHPSFPATLLNFWLLTEPELESLAQFYHQRTPCKWTLQYPCPVAWDANLGLEEKRRRIGRFMGLRGCEIAVEVKSEDEIMEEARQAREGDEEDEILKRKLPWY